ncbi:MAG: MBL fold metallo-hydrolase [Flavobacteriaceae bacterium]|nr:MBL fold metallo-hydrolase [Flavobacteriaceae bacterium]
MTFKIAILFLFLFVSTFCIAQRPPSDIIKTDKGDLIIQPILHGTIVFQWNNKTIYIDPYGGAAAFAGIAKPDIIFITDIHGDHLNEKTLNELQLNNTKIVAPQAVADKLPAKFKQDLIVLNNNESIRRMGILFKAIPMYNLPISPDAKHTKGRGNGYLLEMGGKRIYISGDTEDIPEMRKLERIDVAFVCMNLPYTMDTHQAASAVLQFQPKIVYPYHYRGKPEMSDTESFKKLVNNKNSSIDVRLRNWYPEYE